MRINNNWHPDMPDEFKNSIVTGDARILAERIPDESIDLVFTDPIYDRIDDYRWLAETAARVLKPDRACLVWCGIRKLFEAQMAMIKLDYGWLAIWYQANSRSHIKSELGHCHYAPLLWMKKGDSRPKDRIRDHISTTWSGNGFNHGWSKHPNTIAYYLDAFTQPDDIVFDPFTGGGTVPAVCKMLGRNYVAFEIEPDTAEKARERVRNTQPPLFVLEPEQMDMKLE